jgi:Flp pilus assembly protein TadG
MRERATAHTRTTASVSKKLRPFDADARGVAGIEFGITGLLLVVGLLNAVDVGYYAYKRMEVKWRMPRRLAARRPGKPVTI